MDNVLYSSKITRWRTPPSLFGKLNDEFHFTLDAAASDDNALCRNYYTKATDGLAQSWDGETVFCNPPYGTRLTDAWVRKGSEIKRGICVMLLAARTDTRRWHRWIQWQAEVRLLPGRVHFLNPDGSDAGPAPFPSAVVIWHHLWKER